RHLARRLSLRALSPAYTCFLANTLGVPYAPGVIKIAERKLSIGGDRVPPPLRLQPRRRSMHSPPPLSRPRSISTSASRTRILDSRQLVARCPLPPLPAPDPQPINTAPGTRLPLTVPPPHTRGGGVEPPL